MAREVLQPQRHRRQRQIVQRAILKPFRANVQVVPVADDGGVGNRAASEPRASQLGQRRAARQQTPHPGRVAEQLVERERDEIGMPSRKIERIGRCECRGVEEHIPALRLCLGNPVEGMLYPREIRLGGKGEELMTAGARLSKQGGQRVGVNI